MFFCFAFECCLVKLNEIIVLLQTNARLTAAQIVPLPAEEVEEVGPLEGEGDLWVEKYRPRKYLDLLSDESTNRSLLSWLKMWDKIVFNRYVSISNFNNSTLK